MSTPATAPFPAEQSSNPFGLLVNVLIEPGKAFRALAERPTWWLPIVATVVLALTFITAVSQHVGWDHVVRQAIENNKRTQDLPVDQRENIIQTQAKMSRIAAPIMAVVMVPIVTLIFAGVMMLVFNTILGGTAKFKQAFSVVAYAGVPSLLSTIMAILMLFLKDASDFDINNPVPFNVGYYMNPHTMPAWLVSLGSSIDLFSFWVIFLLALGMATVTKKSLGTALAGVIAPWAIYVIGKVGIAAIFS